MSHGVAMFDMDETITRLSLGDTLDDHWWADEQLRNEGKSIRRQFVPFGTQVAHLPLGPAPPCHTTRPFGDGSWREWGDGSAYSEVNNRMKFKYLTNSDNFEAVKNLVFTGEYWDPQRPDEYLSVKTEAETNIKALNDFFTTLKNTHRLVVLSINGTDVTRCFIDQVFPGVFDEVLGWEDLVDTTTDAVDKKVQKIQEVVRRFDEQSPGGEHRHIFVDDSPRYMEPVAAACSSVQPVLVQTTRVECPAVPAFEENNKNGERWIAQGMQEGGKVKVGGLAADTGLCEAILAHCAAHVTNAAPNCFDKNTGCRRGVLVPE
jgi:hypothetical protein